VEKEQWLRFGTERRARRWAYDELLFGRSDERERSRTLARVREDLEQERDALGRLYRELDAHLARISLLEGRLQELAPRSERDEPRPAPSTTLPHPRAAPAGTDDDRAAAEDRSYSLARCEGFAVESPAGPVGFVEGLRFVSRIDQPDVLEVRGGRFGRQLLLIPSDQVEEVRLTEERVLLRGEPRPTGDPLAELVGRVRRVLHVDQPAS
jgi:hypothetical protein